MRKVKTMLLAVIALAVQLSVALAADPAPEVQQAELSNLGDLYDDFEDLCNLLGPYVPIPYMKTASLCSSTGFGTSNQKMCTVLDLVENTLVYTSKESGGVFCAGSRQTPAASTSLSGKALPFPLSDQRPLPLNLNQNLLTTEGASYYWIWVNLLNFERWAGCVATNTPQKVTPGTPKSTDPSKNWLVPTGWSVYNTVWLADGSASSALYWPFATVMYQGSSVVIYIRGTETEQDWMTDFTYNLTSARLSANLPGRVHQGFSAVASALWPGLKAALNSLIRDKYSGSDIKSVYIAGHSLGAGVATLVSWAVQEYIKHDLHSTIKVDALLFAPPNAGDPDFASHFGQTVNARRIPFMYDVVPQVPCTPTMIGCNNALVKTGTTRNHGLWRYSSVPGTLLLNPANMPQQAEAWSLFDKMYPCDMLKFLEATHICSYNCYLSQFVSDPDNLCWLWNTEGTNPPPGSYCSGFPVSSGPQYPYKPV